MMFDWKTSIENKGKTLADKEKKQKLWQLINRCFLLTQLSRIKKDRALFSLKLEADVKLIIKLEKNAVI